MTTARQIFEATLIELSKIQAPSLKLYEFNYLFNKAINLYINKVYNIYDINLQTTDDLRVLKSTAYLTPTQVSARSYGENSVLSEKLKGATFEVNLPLDYLHLLNCVCVYYVAKQKDCWDAGSYIEIPATRLTADSWSQIITDIYNRPSPMRPYYYIHNVNISNTLPTNPVTDTGGTDVPNEYEVTEVDGKIATTDETGSNFSRTFKLNNKDLSLIERPTASRIGNVSPVRLEIRYGKDSSVFVLREVQIDYVKVPQYIRLTQEQIDLTEDTSQIMEFPDYVNQEIINELVHLVMERTNDPRLANNILISLSIARPTGQLQQSQQLA